VEHDKVVMHFTAFLVLLVGVHGATEYTMDTFDAARAGKSAFVKFLAPW